MKDNSEFKIIPLGDRILVKRSNEAMSQKNKFGGVALPDDIKTRLIINTVISIGDDMPDYFKDRIIPGVRVLTSWFSGIPVDFPEFQIKKEDYRLHTPEELVGIWREKPLIKKRGFFARCLDFIKKIIGIRRGDGGEDKD